MRKYLLFVILMLVAATFSQTTDKLTAKKLIENQQNAQNDFAHTWLSSYQSMIWIATMIMVIFVALMYFAGSFFQNEQIKQLGKTELEQAFVTVIIVGSIIAFVGFVDTMMIYTAGQINSPCLDSNFVSTMPKGITTVNKYAACYVNNLYNMANSVAKGALRTSVGYAAQSYRSIGAQTDTVYLGYLGYMYRPNAHYRLDSEIKRLEFTTLSAYIISLEGQAAFLKRVVPILGPAAILLGLILRSFFFTRKLGGLLLAIGCAILIVLPATYLLAWYTLQIQAYGPQEVEKVADLCPEQCKIRPPWGYNRTLATQTAMGVYKNNVDYGVYGLEDYNTLVDKMIADGKDYLGANDLEGWLQEDIQLCYPNKESDNSDIDFVDSQNCGTECRFYPTQVGTGCNATACDKIPAQCKAIRPMLEKEVKKYCEGNGDKNSEFYCDCPDFCQITQPQVKQLAVTDDNPTGVYPTTNANDMTGQTGEFDCTKCPSQCRAYVSDVTPIKTTHDGQGNDCDIKCKDCMEQRTDTETKQPDLMYGIPSIRSTVCNSAQSCGVAITLAKAIEDGATGVCPIECRINFEGVDNAYKDPLYIKYCEGEYKDACEGRCSKECKINASEIIDAGCEQPPKFYKNGIEAQGTCTLEDVNNEICEMDKKVSYNCARCPEPCRFTNPSPIILTDIGINPYLSRSHNTQQCQYVADEIKYSGSCSDHDFTQYSGISWYGNPKDSLGNPDSEAPKCSAYKKVYKLLEGQPLTCPPYAFEPRGKEQFTPLEQKLAELSLFRPFEQRVEDKDGVTIKYLNIPANPNAASLCADEDAQRFCQDPYCKSDCKVDKSTVGPAVCTIDVTDQYSDIADNEKRCVSCYKINGEKTTGPQCQVYLSWEQTKDTKKGVLPAGCSDSCEPTTTDPHSGGSCNGFCYPRLIIPSANTCVGYNSNTKGNENRDVSNCQACPVECRYDYIIDDNGNKVAQISEDAAKKCGLVYTAPNGDKTNYGIQNPHNCDLICRGRVPPANSGVRVTKEWTDNRAVDFYQYCTQYENYDCDSQSASNGIWVRNAPYDQTNLESSDKCYLNVVENSTQGSGNQNTYAEGQDTATAPNCPDYDDNDKCDSDWYYSCHASYTYKSTNTYYTCSPTSQYAGVDEFINDQSGVSNYYECGTIHEDNTDFNLCDKIGPGQGYDTCSNSTCYATYNARAVECLEGEMYYEDLGLYSEKGNDANCNLCPQVCRVVDDEGNGICSNIEGNMGDIACDSPDQCDLRQTQTDEFANPIGNCPIDLEDNFKLDPNKKLPEDINGKLCAYNQPKAKACPLRCRIDVGANEMSLGCDGGLIPEVGGACDSITPQCKPQLPDTPCLSCNFCQVEECTYKPKIWTECSLCSPQNFNEGEIAMSPADLTSSMSGAKATNTAWRTIGALGVPAIVLPILVIITTLAFTKTLSPLLGGDIEIPGLLKLI